MFCLLHEFCLLKRWLNLKLKNENFFVISNQILNLLFNWLKNFQINVFWKNFEISRRNFQFKLFHVMINWLKIEFMLIVLTWRKIFCAKKRELRWFLTSTKMYFFCVQTIQCYKNAFFEFENQRVILLNKKRVFE